MTEPELGGAPGDESDDDDIARRVRKRMLSVGDAAQGPPPAKKREVIRLDGTSSDE